MPAGLGTRFPACRYVVFNGLARYHGKTLIKGDHWGEWEVLLTGNFTRRRKAKAINDLAWLRAVAPPSAAKLASIKGKARSCARPTPLATLGRLAPTS